MSEREPPVHDQEQTPDGLRRRAEERDGACAETGAHPPDETAPVHEPGVHRIEAGAAEVARWRENFDAFFNTIDDLLFVLDESGVMLHVNETVCRRLGYAAEELVGRSVLDVHPAARREEAGAIVAAMLAGTADVCPVPVVTRDGVHIPVETRVVPGVWDGRPALFGVTKDVSALKRSEEKFARAFDSAPVLMAISTLSDGHFIDVNDMFLTTMGLSRQEVIGHTAEELGLFVDVGQRAAVVRDAGRGGVRHVEIDVRAKDGRVLRGLFSADPVTIGEEPCLLTTMLDLTERRRAEEALAESEALYRSVMNAFPDDVTVTDLDGRVQMLSPAATALFGYEREEEGVGRPLSDFLVPEDWERAGANIARLHEGSAAGPNEYVALRADGTTFPIEVSSELIRDADDRPTGMVFVVRDITARQEAQEKLRESEEQLASAVDGSGVGLWDWYVQTGEETFSERWAEMAGYSLAELEPTSIETWRRLTHPGDLQRADELLEEHFAGKSAIYSFEERVRHKDGHWIWVLDRGKVCEWDDEGRPVRMTGTALDITEAKRTEEALQESEALYRSILSASPENISITDLEGRLRLTSPAALTMFGYERAEESLGRSLLEFVAPEDRERAGADIAAMHSGTAPSSSEYRGLRADGSTFAMEVSGEFIRDARDRPTGMVFISRDVTARRQAEDELRETTTLLSGLLTSIPDIVFFKDQEGVYLGCNPEFARLVGREVAEVVGHTDEDLFGWLVAESFREHDVAMMAQAEPQHNEEWVEYPDGARALVDTLKAPLRDASGQVIGLVGVSRDITARKQASDRIRESEEQLARAVEGSGAGLWDWNVQTREVTFNQRWAEMIGYTLVELGPISVDDWNDMWHPDDLRRSDELIERHLAGKSPMYECEVRVRHKHGHWVWVMDRGKVSEWDDDGLPLRMTGTQMDITARKEAEDAVRLRESYLSAIIENQPGLVWLKDPEGVFLIANGMFAALAGRSGAEEVVGKTDLDLWPRERAERYRRDDRVTMETREPTTYQQEIRFDGAMRWFETFKAPVATESGTLLGTTGYALDVTERRLADERLREANRRLEEAVARANDLAVEAHAATSAKSTFLANMSHEIRSPLNAIIGFAQVLQHDPEASERQKDRLTIINRSGEHLLALLNDILELSKVESGVQRLDPTPFDLRELLSDLALVFRVRAQAKTLTFGVEGLDDVPRYVVADQLKLRQVVTNLLSNAVKFTDSGGVLFRSLADTDEAGSWRLVVQVEDTGPGIAPAETAALFAPFEQTAAGRHSGTGSGLGLAISRQFAEVMGGSLSVESELGAGSIFRLEVPVSAATEEMAARTPTRRVRRLAADQAPCTVLVIDSADGRRLLLDVLTEVGFEVVEAADGFAAAAALARWRPQVVVTGTHVADMSGADVVRHIRRSAGGAGAGIIALTAEATDEIRSDVLAAGADAFMTKPFRQAELLEQIRLLTDVRYVFSEDGPEVPVAEAAPALTPDGMGALPARLKREIGDAAVRARHSRLLELAPHVEAVDLETGAAFRETIARFDYAAVLEALGQETG